jgi:hypothetical protein
MTRADIAEAIEEYGRAAANALAAGADGVEIHAANGHLPHQFMMPTLNPANGRLWWLSRKQAALPQRRRRIGLRKRSRVPGRRETFALCCVA